MIKSEIPNTPILKINSSCERSSTQALLRLAWVFAKHLTEADREFPLLILQPLFQEK